MIFQVFWTNAINNGLTGISQNNTLDSYVSRWNTDLMFTDVNIEYWFNVHRCEQKRYCINSKKERAPITTEKSVPKIV